MGIQDGFYLAYSLPRKPGSRALADSFSVIEVKNTGNTLVVQSSDGSRTLTKAGTEWKDSETVPKLTVTAKMESIRENDMIIGRATYQPTQSETRIDAFVAIRMFADLSPILINDAATDYEIHYEKGETGSLNVSGTAAGELDFGIAKAPAGQSPGRFNATKVGENGHDLFGFVLPHRIKEKGKACRVLVGYAVKSIKAGELEPWSTDDIDPYVAVSARPGLPDDDFA
jgi:hypothetical protein